jgi:pimeloyl-ACP methyl ester carboxylesterase
MYPAAAQKDDSMPRQIELPDGRRFAYRIFGDREGVPVLHLHGLNSSSKELLFADATLKSRGIFLIAVDRPGFGGSTFQKHRSLFDLVEDVMVLMHHLGIWRFGVQSVSAGTAYLLALLHRIPERIISASILSGTVPVDEVGMDGMPKESRRLIELARKAPWLMYPLFWFSYGRLVHKEARSQQFLDAMVRTLGRPDKTLMQDKKARSIFLEIARDSYAQGSRANACDALLVFAKPWGFSLAEIDHPVIRIVHGSEDLAIPIELMRKMHARLKGAKLQKVEGEGHLSLVYRYFASSR